jgi:hypothetical protein
VQLRRFLVFVRDAFEGSFVLFVNGCMATQC